MTIKEINERWLSIQEKRDKIEELYDEGESRIVLTELDKIRYSDVIRLKQDLIEAGFHPVLAGAIAHATPQWDWD